MLDACGDKPAVPAAVQVASALAWARTHGRGRSGILTALGVDRVPQAPCADWRLCLHRLDHRPRGVDGGKRQQAAECLGILVLLLLLLVCLELLAILDIQNLEFPVWHVGTDYLSEIAKNWYDYLVAKEL